MQNDRHEYLVSRGYAVREIGGKYYLLCNGERVSGPYETRAAAWDAADNDSTARGVRALSRD